MAIPKTLVIGAGSMGSAVAHALLAGGVTELHVANSTTASSQRAAEGIAGARAVNVDDDVSFENAVASADLVVLGVKPYQVQTVARQIAPYLAGHCTVLSLAAGVTLAQLEQSLRNNPVVRAMPNTPVRVGAGVVSLSRGSKATDAQLSSLTALLDHAGVVVEVPEEQIHAVIAVAGSAPAYFFYVLEAMVDAAVAQGLKRDVARTFAIQTMLGSAQLLQETGQTPTQAREAVTSPGGTTAQAIRSLDTHAVKAAIAAAMDAAEAKSQSMEQQSS